MAITATKQLSVATVVSLSLSLLAISKAGAYTFTTIADSRDSFNSFSSFPRPAINNKGTVAFTAELDAGGNGIFIGNGRATTRIANTSGPFSFVYSDFSINDEGTVVFTANLDSGGIGIFISSGGATTMIADSSGSFTSVFSPSINNDGTVAFQAFLDTGGEGIFTSSGKAITTITETRDPFVRFFGPAINDRGTVAFGTLLVLNSEGDGIFTNSGGSITNIAKDNGFFDFGTLYSAFPSINNEGTVAFGAIHTRGAGIFTGNGETTTATVASTSTSSPFFLSGFDFSPSINNSRTVAFLANLFTEPGVVGIFTETNGVVDKVIATGDPLLGSTVTNLGFFREGLNDAGQVAFYASLADGTQGIFRADPEFVSKPTSIWGLLVAGTLGLGRWKRQ